MNRNDKMKLWEDLSPEEQKSYIRKIDKISSYEILSYMYAFYPEAKNTEDIQVEINSHLLKLKNIDNSAIRKFAEEKKERQAKEYYYSNLEKTAIDVFYNSHFDSIVLATNFNSEIRLLLIKGEIKCGKSKLKLISYIEERIKENELSILEKYNWGVNWYGLGMPGIDKKDILYQWFNINHIEIFDSFIHDLVEIKELKDCISNLSYPSYEKHIHDYYYLNNQRKNEEDTELIKEQITKWIYQCFSSYIEEVDIVYFKLALFRFLDEEDVEIKEIHVKNRNLKSADLNSFIWVIWYYWNSIKAIKQEKLISFITSFFKDVYKDFQEKGHPKIQNSTIKSHLRDNTGNKIKIPKELMKGNKTK